VRARVCAVLVCVRMLACVRACVCVRASACVCVRVHAYEVSKTLVPNLASSHTSTCTALQSGPVLVHRERARRRDRLGRAGEEKSESLGSVGGGARHERVAGRVVDIVDTACHLTLFCSGKKT
jgi:hypothetical protein